MLAFGPRIVRIDCVHPADTLWTGHAYALNLFKCGLAVLGFVATSMATTQYKWVDDAGAGEKVMWLAVSSIIGIIVGDNLWLESLRLIGTRRMMTVDLIKPWIAALFAWPILDEAVSLVTALGMAITLIGILIVSLEMETGKNRKEESKAAVGKEVEGHVHGADTESVPAAILESDETGGCCAADLSPALKAETLDVDGIEMAVCDQGASAPEVTGKAEDGAPEVNGKSVDLLWGYVWAAWNVLLDVYGSVLTKQWGKGLTSWDISGVRFGTAVLGLALGSAAARTYHWVQASMPPEFAKMPELSASTWLKIALGVVFTTYTCPILQTYAIFKTELATYSTLSSFGPIYAIPLVIIVKGEMVSWRAIAGCAVAVAGVVPLWFAG